jgi:hypothetical protein
MKGCKQCKEVEVHPADIYTLGRADVGELAPQEVYSRGGGDCDGGGDI